MALLDFFRRREDGRCEPQPAPPPIQSMDGGKPFDPRRGAKVGTLAFVVGASVAVALGQFIPQEESGRTVDASLNSDGALVTKHIRGRQYLRAYLDAVGVATFCDGITRINGRPVRMNDSATEEECARLLEKELIAHAGPAIKCTPGIALSFDPATEKQREGPRFTAVSLAYNVGVGNWCGSTAARRFNAGDYAGGCEAATWWNRAGGRVLPGLVTRRGLERNVCLNGLSARFNR